MPRPATKRNRLTSRAPPALSKENAPQQGDGANRDAKSANTSKSESGALQDSASVSRSADNTSGLTNRKQLREQTPLAKSHEQAIESSPTGERVATGSRPASSRPPTRSRGYSSTLSLAGRKGDTSSKVPGTPGFESSLLSNFRRRPRQPSILQMMQAEDGSSDLDDDDFLGGLSPEDESTPLNVSRGKSLLLRRPASPSESSLASSGGSRKRKRATDEVQVPQSPLGVVESTPAGSPVPESDEEEMGEVHPPLESPEVFSQTMVPPMSSSMPPSPAQIPSTLDQPRSPSIAPRRTKKPTKGGLDDKVHLSTAILQDRLLPRRRQRKRRDATTGLDVSSDDSADDNPAAEQDDDELSYPPTRKTSKPQRARAGNTKRLSNEQRKLRTRKDKDTSTKDATAGAAPATKTSKKRHTYGSRDEASGDKENQPAEMSSPLSSPLDSDAFESDTPSTDPEPTAKYLSNELQAQAKKFAEVDQWQMDFEDVVPSDSQGSSFR